MLQSLNEPQNQAVSTTEGPLLVLAGAGTGKTKVLTSRIIHILENGLAMPSEILAVTFTNKAAAEMRHRIETLIGPDARSLWMGTFHSVFSKILRIEAERIGYPSNFTIYDTDDAKSLIRSILKETLPGLPGWSTAVLLTSGWTPCAWTAAPWPRPAQPPRFCMTRWALPSTASATRSRCPWALCSRASSVR